MTYAARRLLWIVVAALIGCAVRWAFWQSVRQTNHHPRHAYRQGE